MSYTKNSRIQSNESSLSHKLSNYRSSSCSKKKQCKEFQVIPLSAASTTKVVYIPNKVYTKDTTFCEEGLHVRAAPKKAKLNLVVEKPRDQAKIILKSDPVKCGGGKVDVNVCASQIDIAPQEVDVNIVIPDIEGPEVDVVNCLPECHVGPCDVNVTQHEPKVSFACPVFNFTFTNPCGKELGRVSHAGY